MKMIIIGLGNPILGDDGVGWVVAERVEKLLDGRRENIDILQLSVGGLNLMEHLIGYERGIIVDAFRTGRHPSGTVTTCCLKDLPDRTTGYMTAAHDTSLQTALALGRKIGVALPEEISVVGVETESTYEFSDRLSRPVESAVSAAACAVLSLLTGPADLCRS